ncbi:hypothetical protein PoB_004935600 [Plakobranchus ocellatus]|uniref:Uncharacterized protein n=1 Tax=Plakobranchus ocellatus TaxID=259542 RepID=A0AAV4BQV0_9GAST|nr:hypothetical protein PoB_004935600 [Plakobranchus ocellatus]
MTAIVWVHRNYALTLRVYHIPEDIHVMLKDYFNVLKMRFSTEGYITDWIPWGLHNIPNLDRLGYGSYPHISRGRWESSRPSWWMLHAAREGFCGRYYLYHPVLQGKQYP